MTKNILLVMLLVLPLAACSAWEVPEDQSVPEAGQSVRQNIAAQIANPNAPQGAGTQVMDGERAGRAIDRYSKGQTIPPEDMDQSKSGKPGGSDSGSATH